MTRNAIVLVTVILFSVLSSCRSGGEVLPSTHSPDLDVFGGRSAAYFMPLNLGNTWKYSREFLGETGDLSVMIVSRDEEDFYVDNQGGRFKITPLGLRDADRYLLLSPLETGQRWHAQIAANVAEHFEILDDSATVTVPAGTFTLCLVVQSTTHATAAVRMLTTATYAPRVGLVRMETRIENNQGRKSRQFLLELTGYSFPGQTRADSEGAEGQPPAETNGAN